MSTPAERPNLLGALQRLSPEAKSALQRLSQSIAPKKAPQPAELEDQQKVDDLEAKTIDQTREERQRRIRHSRRSFRLTSGSVQLDPTIKLIDGRLVWAGKKPKQKEPPPNRAHHVSAHTESDVNNVPPQDKVSEIIKEGKFSNKEGDGHSHHWIINQPNGHESRSACKHCGTERMQKNWLPDTDFITNEEHRLGA